MEDIPHELVDWHAAAVATGVPVTFADRPVPPADLRRAADGMIVFWIENQHGYYWAVDPSTEDHAVFHREHSSDAWRPTGETLEEFLLHHTVREALLGAAAKFSAVLPTESLESGTPVGFAALSFPPAVNESPSARLLCSADVLARIAPAPAGYAPQGEERWMVTVATARGAHLLRYRAGLEPYVLERPREAERAAVPFAAPPF